MMEIRTLSLFKEIALGKTYFEVAEEHHLSQSSLSKLIMRLEEELNTSLFDRKKRSVTLTPAGHILLEIINRIEPIVQEGLTKIDALSALRRIRIAIIPNTDYMNLDLRIPASQFAKDNPSIDMELVRENFVDESFEFLQRDEIDILVTKLFQSIRDYCEYEEIADDPMYVIMRNDHPLANQPTINFKNLYNEHVISRSFVVRRALQESCNRLGLDMLPHLEFIDSKSLPTRLKVLNLVSVGKGITIYFQNDLRPLSMRNLCCIPVVNVPNFPVVLAKRKGRELDFAQRKCWNYLRKELSITEW